MTRVKKPHRGAATTTTTKQRTKDARKHAARSIANHDFK